MKRPVEFSPVLFKRIILVKRHILVYMLKAFVNLLIC